LKDAVAFFLNLEADKKLIFLEGKSQQQLKSVNQAEGDNDP
jgi:hypothetical protein